MERELTRGVRRRYGRSALALAIPCAAAAGLVLAWFAPVAPKAAQPLADRAGRFGDQAVFSLTGNALLALVPPGTGPRVPYLVAGAGYYGTEVHSLGLNAGAGLRLRMAGQQLFLEGRLHDVAALNLSRQYGRPRQFASATLGLRF